MQLFSSAPPALQSAIYVFTKTKHNIISLCVYFRSVLSPVVEGILLLPIHNCRSFYVETSTRMEYAAGRHIR